MALVLCIVLLQVVLRCITMVTTASTCSSPVTAIAVSLVAKMLAIPQQVEEIVSIV